MICRHLGRSNTKLLRDQNGFLGLLEPCLMYRPRQVRRIVSSSPENNVFAGFDICEISAQGNPARISGRKDNGSRRERVPSWCPISAAHIAKMQKIFHAEEAKGRKRTRVIQGAASGRRHPETKFCGRAAQKTRPSNISCFRFERVDYLAAVTKGKSEGWRPTPT